MLMLWCLVVAQLLTMANFEDLNAAGDINISDDEILKTFLEAQEEVLNDAEKEREFQSASGTSDVPYHPQIKADLKHRQRQARIWEMTTRKLADQMGFSLKTKQKQELLRGFGSKIVERLQQAAQRSDTPKCDSKQHYSNLDGTCNNLDNPAFGSANTAFVRLSGAEPEYADGISKPRQAQDGSDLPNARHVSLKLFTNNDRESALMSHMAMTWGQYLDHDITLAAHQHVSCDNTCNDLTKECFGISIPADDPHFSKMGVNCIALKRDAPAPSTGLAVPREHTNILTAFIDASQVYGVDKNTLESLRNTAKGQGLLKEMPHPSGSLLHGLLPTATAGFCRSKDPVNQPCFKAGDARVNVNAGLIAIHNLAVREHNRIAKELKLINQEWNEEKLFYETRKIVAALHQHITYNEYLPEILDKNIIDQYELKLEDTGFYTDYNSEINPSISSSFAVAAFRFGHSQIRDLMNRYGKKHQKKYPPWHTNQYFNPGVMYDVSHGGVDGLLRGLVKDHSQEVDGSFSKAVQQELVRGPGDVSDLAAINIQRGRERGLPGYNTFRSLCGLQKATSFDQLEAEIPSAIVDEMAKIYKHPDDVELFVGGILENHMGTGAVGPTFGCLIAEQFKRLRSGDRFWYENNNEVGFTADQLQELRKVSLARMLCDNSDGIKEIPNKALSVKSVQVSCDSLPSMDLNKWKAYK